MNDLPLVSEKEGHLACIKMGWKNMWKYSTVNPLKSDKVIVSLNNLSLESNVYVTRKKEMISNQ